MLMATLFGAFPFLLKLYADGGYQGPEFHVAMKRTLAHVNVEIVKRRTARRGSWSCQSGGWWSGHSRGSIVAAGWRRTGSASPKSPRLPQARLNPPHAPKTMQSNMMFPDRL